MGRLRLQPVLLPGVGQTGTGALTFTLAPSKCHRCCPCPGRELGVCRALCVVLNPGVNLVWLPLGQVA